MPGRFVTAPASLGPVLRTAEAKGIINPEQTFFVSSNVSGAIQNVFCDVDTQVKKEQACAKIGPRLYQDGVMGTHDAIETVRAFDPYTLKDCAPRFAATC